jgi:hypothetical protein
MKEPLIKAKTTSRRSDPNAQGYAQQHVGVTEPQHGPNPRAVYYRQDFAKPPVHHAQAPLHVDPAQISTVDGLPMSRRTTTRSAKRDSARASDEDDDVYLGDAHVTGQRLKASTIPDLKKFTGKDLDPEHARGWLTRLSRAGRREQFTADEMLDLFTDNLVGTARNWFKQLPKQIRRSWSLTLEQFQIQYYDRGTVDPEKYYGLHRRGDETPFEYLYRLNVAAKEAKICYGANGSAQEQRNHVHRFFNSVDDADLVRTLVIRDIRTAKELESALASWAKASHRLKKLESKPRTNNDFVRDPKSRDRPARVNVTRKVRFDSSLHSTMGTEDGFQESDLSSDSDPQSKKQSNLAVLTRSRTNRDPCPVCGSTRHRASNCWRNMTCTHCGRSGHPGDRCRHVCKSCYKVHEIGECPHAEFFKTMVAWYDPDLHQGTLPPKAEDALK